MKTLQNTRKKLNSNGIKSRDISDVSGILKTNCNLILDNGVKVHAKECNTVVKAKAPRGVDVTMYLVDNTLHIFNKEGKSITIKSLREYE